jgi:hypothetical protein
MAINMGQYGWNSELLARLSGKSPYENRPGARCMSQQAESQVDGFEQVGVVVTCTPVFGRSSVRISSGATAILPEGIS